LALLSLLVFTPIIGAVIVYLAGFANEKLSKALTILISASTIAITLFIFFNWAPVFGLTFTLGIDGISLPLLIISGLLTTLSAAGSWEQIKTKVREYNALLLLFEGAIIGVFTSLNLIAFYVFWELVLIPMFFFIGVWGGPRKKYAAMKFLIMTHVGSILILLSFIALYVLSTPHTFDFTSLVNTRLPLVIQIMISIGFFIGFGVKLPIVPFHTWLPDAHVEAPAPIRAIAQNGGIRFHQDEPIPLTRSVKIPRARFHRFRAFDNVLRRDSCHGAARFQTHGCPNQHQSHGVCSTRSLHANHSRNQRSRLSNVQPCDRYRSVIPNVRRHSRAHGNENDTGTAWPWQRNAEDRIPPRNGLTCSNGIPRIQQFHQ
jgi:hypothetical protein